MGHKLVPRLMDYFMPPKMTEIVQVKYDDGTVFDLQRLVSVDSWKKMPCSEHDKRTKILGTMVKLNCALLDVVEMEEERGSETKEFLDHIGKCIDYAVSIKDKHVKLKALKEL